MYVNPATPSYFNWLSWQSWLCYTIALLNALLAASLVFYALDVCSWRWELTVTFGIITTIIQIGLGIAYLKSRESKGGPPFQIQTTSRVFRRLLSASETLRTETPLHPFVEGDSLWHLTLLIVVDPPKTSKSSFSESGICA